MAATMPVEEIGSPHVSDGDVDSLFDGSEETEVKSVAIRRIPRSATVEGLDYDPDLQLAEATTLSVLQCIKEADYFKGGRINQIMLFDAPQTPFPGFLLKLLEELSGLLRYSIPLSTYDLLFPKTPSCSRQAILNLYKPGEGITPHVDLLARFGDGIMVVSLGSGIVMDLVSLDDPTAALPLWLEPRSVLVLAGQARYRWTHGIASRLGDWVDDDLIGEPVYIERDVRVSITLRWMLPGADIVGSGISESQRD